MMDWIFCNKCSLKYQPNFKFYLLECGHIFCEKCIEKQRQTKKCILCNQSTSAIELSKDMDYTTQVFFWPIETMMQQSLQVFNFQAMHKSLFLQSLNRKYSYAKRECINYYNANKKLQKENQLLRDTLKSIGYQPPNPFITSTPATHSKPPCDSNISLLSSIRFTPSHRIISSRQENKNASSITSSTHGPSPAQLVPKGYPVPVHRDMSMQNLAAATPNFKEKIRGNLNKPGFHPSFGYPRK